MERSEADVLSEVYGSLQAYLIKSSLSLQLEDTRQTGLLKRHFDIVIYKGIAPLAVVEVKSSLTNKNILARATDQIRSALVITNARFGIVTDNESFYLYDRSKKDLDFVSLKLIDIITRIINPDKVRVARKYHQQVLKIILDAAQKHLNDNLELLQIIRGKSFLSLIQFDSVSNTFHLSGDDNGTNSFENQFFIKLLGEFTQKQVCRYTSLQAIFSMVNNNDLIVKKAKTQEQ